MESITQLLARHGSVLLLDASSSVVQVCLFASGVLRAFESTEEAGVALFQAVEEVLAPPGMCLREVGAFAFCEGPGSVLGIRTSAVALRTWNTLHIRPAYAFGSLQLVATQQLREGRPVPFSVIADARRDSWHRVQVDADAGISGLQRVRNEELSGPLLLPQPFRHWAPPPPQVEKVPYTVGAFLTGLCAEAPLFRAAEEPDAFLHEDPVYKTWTPQVHRAPK